MRFSRMLLTLAAAAIPVASAAQQPLNPVRWSVQSPPASVTAGKTVRIELTAQIDEGWHLYALEQEAAGPMPTQLSAGPSPAFTLDAKEIDAPDPQKSQDPNFGTETAWYAESAVFGLPVKVAAGTAPGEQTIELKARFQACNDSLCLRPSTVTLPVKVKIRK